MFHNTTSSMVINACIITVCYDTHFIPRISVLIVCLDKEIDDGFTFLLFAGYKFWFLVFQDQGHPTTECFQIRQKCIKWFSLRFRSLFS